MIVISNEEKRGVSDKMKPLCRICGNWISLERDEYHMLRAELIQHECLMRMRTGKATAEEEEMFSSRREEVPKPVVGEN